MHGVKGCQSGSRNAFIDDPDEAGVMQLTLAFSYRIAAGRLDVSESTVMRLVKAGQLPRQLVDHDDELIGYAFLLKDR